MAITKLDQVKVPMKLNYGARAIVTKAAILKNRDKELQNLLGRIKALLGEDEVLIIAKNDTFADATKRKPDPRDIATIKVNTDKDIGHEALEQMIREIQRTPLTVTPQTTVTGTWVGGNTYTYETYNNPIGMDRRGRLVNYNQNGQVTLTNNNTIPRNDIPGGEIRIGN